MSPVKPLIVDLEAGLLRTDMAREEFWRALGEGGWRRLLAGAPTAANYLRNADAADLANLPMDGAVVEAMRSARAGGRRVVLVSDEPVELARRFADALDFVDEAAGGAPAGAARATWLAAQYGEQGYDYVGGAETPRAGPAKAYLRALRPHQWVKNLLVFLPVIAAHRFDAQTLALTFIAFVAFCLVASSVYILNDLLDLSADRAHPRKRRRPMASGAVPLGHAGMMAVAGLVGGLALALLVGSPFVAALCGYTILTTAYSLQLKREPILDVCVLAALYTLRIIAGAVAGNITLSVWLLAFAIFLFLSLAAIKRQAELVDNMQTGRDKVMGRGYTVGDLPIVEIMSVAAGYVAVLVLALYLNAPNVVGLYATPEALWVVCAVLLYWISRAVMIAHRGEMHDDPIVFALRDRVSHVCGVVVLAALAAAIWW